MKNQKNMKSPQNMKSPKIRKNPWLNISLSDTVADCDNTMSHSLCGGNRGKSE